MEISFDLRGNLMPEGKINLDLKVFQQNFVDRYDEDSTRYEIFKNFERYLKSFRNEVTPSFKIWIDGSFVSNKKNPSDIDFISLIDDKIAFEKADIIRSKFVNQSSLRLYKLDAYVLVVYPEGHKDYIKSKSDLLYWYHWFTYTKKNRNKVRFQKGFVEIEFE